MDSGNLPSLTISLMTSLRCCPGGLPAGQVHEVGDAVTARGRVPVRTQQTGFDVFVRDWFVEHVVVCHCENLLHLF